VALNIIEAQTIVCTTDGAIRLDWPALLFKARWTMMIWELV